MTNDRGRLIQLREAAARGQMSVSTLRALMAAHMGPPAFKRPGSTRWLFWTAEFDTWLESGRVKQSA
jgi:predicted DNA-binding transcriptional regulator AlpA